MELQVIGQLWATVVFEWNVPGIQEPSSLESYEKNEKKHYEDVLLDVGMTVSSTKSKQTRLREEILQASE